jgi:hypothetical protein
MTLLDGGRLDCSEVTRLLLASYSLGAVHLESMLHASQGRSMPSARSVFRHNGQYEGSKLGGGALLLASVP